MKRYLMPALCVATALMLSLVVSSAHAQSAGDRAAAQALFDEGMRLFKQGDFAKACPKFQASVKIIAGTGNTGKLAECYEKLGKTASAWALYRQVAVKSRRAGQLKRAEVANKRAKQLEARLSYVTIEVAASAKVSGLVVRRNGVVVSAGAFGTAIAVDPGKQTIVASAKGHKPWTRTLEVAASAKQVVALPALQVIEKAKPAPDIQVKPAPVKPPIVVEPAPPKRGIAGYVVGGLGVAVIGVAVFLTMDADDQWEDAFTSGECDRGTNLCSQAGLDATSDARSKSTIGAVLLGVGAVGVLAGAAMWMWLRPAVADKPLAVLPAAGRDQVGLVLRGNF